MIATDYKWEKIKTRHPFDSISVDVYVITLNNGEEIRVREENEKIRIQRKELFYEVFVAPYPDEDNLTRTAPRTKNAP